jgi:hypothetical protein
VQVHQSLSVDPSEATVLFGAGVGFPVGVPTAVPLVDAIVRAAVTDSEWAARFLEACQPSGPIRFESVMGWVSEVLDADLEVLAFLDKYDTPGPLHHAFSWAALRGACLLTVNFDHLQELAVTMAGHPAWTVDAHHSGDTPADREGIDVLKLHGTRLVYRGGRKPVQSRRPLHATIEQIVTSGGGGKLAEAPAALLASAVNGRTLVLAGYSGMDDLDIVPALAATEPYAVVWCDHADGEPLEAVDTGRTGVDALLAGWKAAGVHVTVLRGDTEGSIQGLGWDVPTVHGLETQRQKGDRRWRDHILDWAAVAHANDPTGRGFVALAFGDLGLEADSAEALREAVPADRPDALWSEHRHAYEVAQAELRNIDDDPSAAVDLARRATQLAEAAGDRHFATLSALCEARSYIAAGHLDSADAPLEYAETVVLGESDVTPEYLLGTVLLWKARLQYLRSNTTEAVGLARRAEDASRSIGDLGGASEGAIVAGLSFLEDSDIDGAVREFGRAKRIAESVPHLDRVVTAATMLAMAATANGDPRHAVSVTASAIPLAENLVSLDYLTDLHRLRGEALLDDGLPSAAEQAFASAVDLADESTFIHLLLCRRAESLVLSGRAQEALSVLAESPESDDEWTAIYEAVVRHAAGDESAQTLEPPIKRALETAPGEAVIELGLTIARLRVQGRQADRLVDLAAQTLDGRGASRRAAALRGWRRA